MSHMALAIGASGRSIRSTNTSQATGLQIFPGFVSTDMAFDHVPLAERAADELLARAVELRAMAATATTQDVVRALQVLADRYVALAERRRAEEAHSLGRSSR